jgi:ABC-type multidrug transport system fused ATPase/permease subunit
MDLQDQPQPLPQPLPQPQIEPGIEGAPAQKELTPEQRRTLIIVIIAAVLLCAVIGGFALILLNMPAESVAQIRDVFIIFMGLMSLLLGVVLVILITQLARLINLLQNELGPILDSLNETISNLRGTTVFLSENVTEPIIRLNEYLAGINQFWAAIGLVRRSSQKSKEPKGE